MSSLLDRYHSKIEQRQIRFDPEQRATLEQLEKLRQDLKGYVPYFARNPLQRLLASKKQSNPIGSGLYIYGEVGRGKSMMMDLFFHHLSIPCKTRVHFHAFMQDVHRRLHTCRTHQNGDDNQAIIRRVAQDIAKESWVLCFDEFVVNDIADAMIMARLFTVLLELGVIVIATSNFAPDELYKDGLQRELFLPFIALLKNSMTIWKIGDGFDYRSQKLQGHQVFFVPDSDKNTQHMHDLFDEIAEGIVPTPQVITVFGRQITLEKTVRGAVWVEFDELCRQAYGAADFVALARQVHSVFMTHIPQIRAEERDVIRRFITLIDNLYEHRVKLVASFQVPVEQIYPAGPDFFQFARTLSRLQEMQAVDYLALPHVSVNEGCS